MNIQLRRVTLADQFMDTRHLLQHEGEYYVLAVGAPSLADDLRAWVLSIEHAPMVGGTCGIAEIADRLRDILRKHGEGEE